jgi:hypothetical protein
MHLLRCIILLTKFRGLNQSFLTFWHKDVSAAKVSSLPYRCSQLFMLNIEHNFFEPQPIKDAAVFTMRLIIHDWPDESVRKILKYLRSAAQTTTKLLIIDHILPYCTPTRGKFSDIPGAEVSAAPEPLLPNFGYASGAVYSVDLEVRELFLL